MAGWLIWLIAAGITAILEIVLPGFFMLSISFGCLGGMIASFLGFGIVWECIIAVLVMVLFVTLLRPVLYSRADNLKQGAERLIGQTVVVTEDIIPPLRGRAVINGVEWAASADEIIRQGEEAEVVSIGGATLHLKFRNNGKEE